VTVGSILEYRYKLNYPANALPPHQWIAQHDLFTVKENFGIQSYTGPIRGVEGGVGLSVFQNLPKNAQIHRKGEGFELQLENVPAFEEEAYMPPRDSYIYHVTMVYGGKEMTSLQKFWHQAGLRWNDEAEHFMGNYKEIRRAAAEAAGDEADLEKRLRRLYTRAQQIRNLTYEYERTEEEQKKENLKPNQNVVDVLSRGYGDRADVTRLFVALARAGGFEAWILKSSNRSERIFDPALLDAYQLDSEFALVRLNGNDIYLDPGTRFCPFGLLRWVRTSTKALKLDKKGGTFVDVPLAPCNQAVISRNVEVSLETGGTLKGDLTVEYRGSEALERRLEAIETDDAGRTKILEDEIKEWLPNGADAELKKAEGWESSGDPLTAQFTIVAPGSSSLTGKHLLVAGYFFHAARAEAFQQQNRRFPVYLPFAFEEHDRVAIRVPEGVLLESVPQQQGANIGYAAYQSVSRLNGTQLLTERILKVNGIFFRPDQYAEVRGFFNKVQMGDEQQAVLQGGSANAQKSN
jgi:Transglutaminase-like superfamily